MESRYCIEYQNPIHGGLEGFDRVIIHIRHKEDRDDIFYNFEARLEEFKTILEPANRIEFRWQAFKISWKMFKELDKKLKAKKF